MAVTMLGIGGWATPASAEVENFGFQLLAEMRGIRKALEQLHEDAGKIERSCR
jgi:hypothetical protein